MITIIIILNAQKFVFCFFYKKIGYGVIEVKKPPYIEEVQKFRGNTWNNAKEFNPDAEWIKRKQKN